MLLSSITYENLDYSSAETLQDKSVYILPSLFSSLGREGAASVSAEFADLDVEIGEEGQEVDFEEADSEATESQFLLEDLEPELYEAGPGGPSLSNR